jgi:hypothetical protein
VGSIVEIILSLFLMSNAPIFVDERYVPPEQRCIVAGYNCLKAKLTLHVRKEIEMWWGGHKVYIDIRPYVAVNERFVAKNAGGILELGYTYDDITVAFYHHSSHNLDHSGQGLELNGVVLKWRLFE